MFRNHLKTALRRLARNRAVSAINILGLTLGMAVTFVILIYVFHELSYDDFQEKKNRIYRVVTEQKMHGWENASTPHPLADRLESDYPAIKTASRVGLLFDTRVRKGQEFLPENRFLCADPDFPRLFTMNVLRGNRGDFLDEPEDVVLTESMAGKYFGSLDILGETLEIKSAGERIVLKVSGVMKDLPETSTLEAGFFASTELFLSQIGKIAFSGGTGTLTPDDFRGSWDLDVFMTYLLVDEGFDEEKFDGQLARLEEEMLDPEKKGYHLQAMEDFYFHSGHLLSEYTVKGDLKQVYIFSLVAFLILLVASINYLLLGSAQALSRVREIGIRKITGATRKILFRQVLVESLLITIIAFPLSLILIEQARPVLIRFLEKDFIHYSSLGWEVIPGFLLVVFLLSYIPGLFIVRYYSQINAASVVIEQNAPAGHKMRMHKVLMAVQFTVFLILVSCSLGIYQQLQYASHHDLGFEPEGVVTFSLGLRSDTEKDLQALKQELLNNPRIESVGAAMWALPSNNTMSYDLPMPDDPEQSVSIDALYVDRDFTRVMGIELLEGKPFSAFSDENDDVVLINETARDRLQLEDPVGKKLGGNEITGVIKDFHHNSFRKKISPMMLIKKTPMARTMMVKVKGEPDKAVLSDMGQVYRSVLNASIFDYQFLSERFDELYKKERRLGIWLMLLSGIAIGISSMGLLGLTIFQARKRTREIAIRKVNGARVGHLMGLLSGNYLKLIVWAAVVSFPVSWWLLNLWLQNFAYQVDLSWGIFPGALMLAVVITLLTVGFQTYQAARANPADSLRHE